MLSRVNGGNSGIADYLIHGIKHGREFGRDELDQRIILAGDLSLTDTIINSIQDKGQERYLHITLSFRESNIDREILEAVTQEYKSFLMTAYGEDEYHFYAEAHLPKIKHIKDRKTGEMVERKPHIHIVIPEKNILTGKYLNPRGVYNHHIKYFDAIDEHINLKYHLESPKDFVRQGEEYHAQMISRIKGDFYREKHGELKKIILSRIEKEKINEYKDFVQLVSEYGEVTTRNAGKDNEYIAVKLSGDNKFTNLKSPVFRRSYIEHREVRLEKPTPKQIADRLEAWKTTVSKEIKYISNASANVKADYKSATLEVRRMLLNDKEKQFEQRYRGAVRDELRSKLIRPFGQTRLTIGLPGLQKRDVVHRAWGKRQRSESILRRDASRVVDDERADQHHGLRRSRSGRDASNRLVQLAGDIEEAKQREADRRYFAQVRRYLKPERLLDELEKRFAIAPSQYRILAAKDGSPRINVGRENLNVSDFLTKHMNLKWDEAKALLRSCFDEQRTQHRYARADMWKTSWAAYREDRQRVFGSSLSWQDKKQALSIVIFERLKREERLHEAFGSISRGKTMQLSPLEKPAETIAANRIAPHSLAVENRVTVERKQREDEFILRSQERLKMNDLFADKSTPGEVIFKSAKDGSIAFRDKGDSLLFSRQDMSDEKLLLGLEFAVAKYGNALNLGGSEAFKMKLVELAARHDELRIEFKPREYQHLLKAKQQEIAMQASVSEKTSEVQVAQTEQDKLREERIDANARTLKARADELKELFLSGKAVYGERGLEMLQPTSAKKDTPSQPLVSEQEKPEQEDGLEPQIREALRLLEEARAARKVDEKRASELFKQAAYLAKEQGKRDAAIGKPMPKAFEKEEPLRDFWKDGIKAYTRSMDRERGMDR